MEFVYVGEVLLAHAPQHDVLPLLVHPSVGHGQLSVRRQSLVDACDSELGIDSVRMVQLF